MIFNRENNMNKTIKTQLEHRSIREFESEQIPVDLRELLLDVANMSATSTGMQRYSLIRLSDQDKKDAFAKICNQPYVAKAPEVWMFVVDCYRNAQIAREMGVHDEHQHGNMDFFFQGFTDAVIAAQNTYLALESLGLGGVFLGSPLNDAQAVIELLGLPKLTFPALGIAFGYPAQLPEKKPRISIEHKYSENEYQCYDSYKTLLASYDEELQQYRDARTPDKPFPAFTTLSHFFTTNPHPKRQLLLQVIRSQGFDMSALESTDEL